MKSIETFVTQAKVASANQETIFNSIITNLSAEFYDVVLKNSEVFAVNLR